MIYIEVFEDISQLQVLNDTLFSHILVCFHEFLTHYLEKENRQKIYSGLRI